MGNSVQSQISKKKKLIKVFCYISLVLLNILLFLPVICRTFVKESSEPKEKSVVTILNCNKTDESINSTFLNNEPQNILYQLKGNYLETVNPDEDTEIGIDTATVDSDSQNINQDNSNLVDSNNTNMSLYEIFKPVSEISYKEEENTTSMRFDTINLSSSDIYEKSFKTLNAQKNYYESLGFSCTETTV